MESGEVHNSTVSPDASGTRRLNSTEFADNLYDHVFKVWANPEVSRRIANGQVKRDYKPWAVQVLMEPDAPTIMRFDGEVWGLITVKPGLSMSQGESISPATFHEIAEDVSGFELLQHDSPNAGHITLIRHQRGFFIAFDFTYNSARVSEHLEAAKEFLDMSAISLDKGTLRPFVTNLYQAVELLAKASLFRIPAEGIVNSRSHDRIRSQYNLYSQVSDMEAPFASLLNRLDALKNPARYPDRTFGLEATEGKAMQATAEQMYDAILNHPRFRRHESVSAPGSGQK